MYRCDVCDAVTRSKDVRKTHKVERLIPNGHDAFGNPKDRREIEREIPVCHECAQMLADGVPLPVMQRQKGKPIVLAPGKGKILTQWPEIKHR